MSVRSSAQSAGADYSLLNHSFVRPRKFNLAILNSFVSSEMVHFGGHGKSLRPIIHILMISSPEQLIHSLKTRHLTEVQQHNKNAALLSSHSFSNKK
jgi:hypothetical protein